MIQYVTATWGGVRAGEERVVSARTSTLQYAKAKGMREREKPEYEVNL